MLIEIKELKLTPASVPIHLRIGVDVLAGISLGLSEDMRRIETGLDINLDDLEVKILYLNPPQGGQVADTLVFLGRGLAAAILDLVIPVAFSLSLPELPIVLADRPGRPSGASRLDRSSPEHFCYKDTGNRKIQPA
jgi:hypothetical protein